MIKNFLYPDFTHVLCFTEDHLNQHEINLNNIVNCSLGAKYCRHSLTKRDVCIFVHNNRNFINIVLDKFYNDQDIEACAVKLSYFPYNICILLRYRVPTGNFIYFINKLEIMLISLYKTNTQSFAVI